MITVRLDDGAVINFPDETSQQEIATAVAKYYTVPASIEAAVAVLPLEAVGRPDPVSDAPQPHEVPPHRPAELVRIWPAIRRWDVGPYQEDPSVDEQVGLQIDELKRRSGRRDPPHPTFDPPEPGNEGRDNMISSWSQAYAAQIGALPPPELEPEPPPRRDPEAEKPKAEAERGQRERAENYRRAAEMSRRLGPRSAIDFNIDRRFNGKDWARS